MLLSLPDTWHYSVRGLAAISLEGVDGILTAFSDLLLECMVKIAAKLQTEFPADYQSRIERLSEYMASSGRRYKNHLATIRSWARRDSKQSKLPAYSHANYRYKEGESL